MYSRRSKGEIISVTPRSSHYARKSSTKPLCFAIHIGMLGKLTGCSSKVGKDRNVTNGEARPMWGWKGSGR